MSTETTQTPATDGTPDSTPAKPRELGWLGSRIVRGLREAPREYTAWRQATEWDQDIADAEISVEFDHVDQRQQPLVEPDHAQQVEAVQRRHHQVEQDQPRPLRAGGLHRLQRLVDRDEAGVAGVLQIGLGDVGHHRLVVDHHDGHIRQRRLGPLQRRDRFGRNERDGRLVCRHARVLRQGWRPGPPRRGGSRSGGRAPGSGASRAPVQPVRRHGPGARIRGPARRRRRSRPCRPRP